MRFLILVILYSLLTSYVIVVNYKKIIVAFSKKPSTKKNIKL